MKRGAAFSVAAGKVIVDFAELATLIGTTHNAKLGEEKLCGTPIIAAE
jgi:hypothetical protein